MRTHTALCLSLMLVLPWTAPRFASAGRDRSVEFETVLVNRAPGGFSALAGDFVFRDAETWCDFWSQASINDPTQPLGCPELDFRREVVIASGATSCAGFDGLRIDSIERAGSRRAVSVVVQHLLPGPGCYCITLAIDIPIHAVVVSRPIGEVEFVHESIQVDCSAGGR